MEGLDIELVLRATMERVGSVVVTAAEGSGDVRGFRVKDACFLFNGGKWVFTRKDLDALPSCQSFDQEITFDNGRGMYSIGDLLLVNNRNCQWKQSAEDRALMLMHVPTTRDVWDLLRTGTEEVFGISPTDSQFGRYIPVRSDFFLRVQKEMELTPQNLEDLSRVTAVWLGVSRPPSFMASAEEKAAYWDEVEAKAKAKGVAVDASVPKQMAEDKRLDASGKMYDAAVDIIADTLGIKVAAPYLAAVLGSNSVLKEIVTYGANDTEVRGKVANEFSQYIGAGRLPTYGTPEAEADAYWVQLNEKAKAAGLRLIGAQKPKQNKVSTARVAAGKFFASIIGFSAPSEVLEVLFKEGDDLIDHINWWIRRGPEVSRITTQVAVLRQFLNHFKLTVPDEVVEAMVLAFDNDILEDANELRVSLVAEARAAGYLPR